MTINAYLINCRYKTHDMENTNTTLLEATSEMELEQVDSRKIRTQRGFTLIGFGAIILIIGCILSIIADPSHLIYDFILYGPTTLGAIMVIYGMYKVME